MREGGNVRERECVWDGMGGDFFGTGLGNRIKGEGEDGLR